jgi:hypothetical protein
MPRPFPIAAITFDASTGLFGYRVWFEGRKPHNEMTTFRTAEGAKNWLDPQRERVWEATPGDSGDVIEISRKFLPGTVAERIQSGRGKVGGR